MMSEVYGIQNEKIVLMEMEQKESLEHAHNYLEFVYITEGEGWHWLNGLKTKIQAGDYFIIDYHTTHGYENLKNKPFCLINCLFLPEFIDPVLKACTSFETLMNNHLIHFHKNILKNSPVNNIFRDDDRSIYVMLRILVEEYQNKPYGYLERMRCKLIEILILMMRNLIDCEKIPETDLIISEMLEKIRQNYKTVTLQSLAKEMNYSAPYLSIRFKQVTGVKFTEYLQKIRIETCCNLLMNTEKTVDEIAEEAGYTDMKFFHKLFKKHMAVSPNVFRKNNR